MKIRPTLQCFFVIIFLAFCARDCASQGFSVESRVPPSVTVTDKFVSLEGRFSIALPKDFHGFQPLSFDTAAGRVNGDSYTWRMKEGTFNIQYVTFPRVLEDPNSVKKILDGGRDGLMAQATASQGKFDGERDLSLQGHPGREIRVLFSDRTMVDRIYLVSTRMYQLFVLSKANEQTDQVAVTKIFDSFRFLTDAEVEALARQKIADTTPSPLPQEPVTPRPRSDAEDEGLRGSVKTAFRESEDLSGTWAVGRRKPSATEYYNQRGNLTKRESYDWKGNLFDIVVYGYLDGSRVSHFKSIQYEYDPPPMIVATPPGAEKPRYDQRYSYKFEYKYDDRNRLTEKVMYGNAGKLALRYVYKYTGNQKEEFVYSADGKLNQHYLYTLDDKGNKIEETVFEAPSGSIRDKYSYSYEFDAKGNWIKQTTSKWVTKDGRSYYEPSSVDYRTITYY